MRATTETEITLRNPKLRLIVNLALIAIFAVLLIWQMAMVSGDRAELRRVLEQLPVLERDQSLNEQKFLTEQTLVERSRPRMTAQESVLRSQKLQELRDTSDRSRKLLEQQQAKRDELQKSIRGHHMIIIIGLIAVLILLGVNYILDY
jgi:hypothetical protein